MVIEDLARDRRFANNPLLRSTAFVSTPASAPRRMVSDRSLCLLDMKPRQLTEREKRLSRNTPAKSWKRSRNVYLHAKARQRLRSKRWASAYCRSRSGA